MRIMIAVLVTMLAGCSAGDRTCSLVGCRATASIDVITGSDLAAVAGATLTVCVADRCTSGQLVGTLPDAVGTGLAARFEGPFRVDAVIWRREDGWTVTADVIISDDSSRDGDVYTATLDANGTRLASVTLRATYHDESPNGEDCSPVCHIAELAP